MGMCRRTTRSTVVPFAPAPPRFVHDNFEGNACLAIPSKSKPNAFYPVLALPVAKGTLEPAIKDLSNLFNDPTGKCRPEDLRSVASLAASIFEPLAAMHSTGNAHRDVKPSNFLVFSFRPGMAGRVHRSPNGELEVVRLNDFGKGVPFGQRVVAEKRSAPVPTGKAGRSKQRGANVLARNVPLCRNNEHTETALEQRKAVEALLKQHELLPKPIAVKGGKDRAPGIYAISTRALHLQTGCFPSQAKDGDPPVPILFASGYGTAHFAPPESQPYRREGEEFLSARDWQSGDMWAAGLIVAEMVKGKGRRIVFSPEDNHGKMLFATDDNKLFWNKHLEKSGNIPDEWEQCVDLIRNLCAYDPSDRLTASAALQHPFITQLETNLES